MLTYYISKLYSSLCPCCQVHLIGGDVDERQLLVADKNVKFASLHHCVQLIQLNALSKLCVCVCV